MNENKTNINWFPGHMKKTKRLIEEKYDSIDLVYEIIDARIPFSSKIKDIDNLIKNKPILSYLNITKFRVFDQVALFLNFEVFHLKKLKLSEWYRFELNWPSNELSRPFLRLRQYKETFLEIFHLNSDNSKFLI